MLEIGRGDVWTKKRIYRAMVKVLCRAKGLPYYCMALIIHIEYAHKKIGREALY